MAINITQRIDDLPVSGFQIRVVLLCGLVALLDGLDIQTMAITTPHIAREWGMEPGAFGPVLSMSFAGIMLGTILLGTLGDRIGRRRLVLIAFVALGLSSIFTAFAQTMGQLAILRLITGFAIGGCLPNVTALTTEYVPAKRAGMIVTLMYAAVPLGGVTGSLLAGSLIAAIGWQGVFLIGGVVPLVICALLCLALPESVRFLVARGDDPQKVASILGRIDPGYVYAPGDSFTLDHAVARRGSLSDLFRSGLRPLTLLIWLIFFFSMAVMYLLTSWLPSIFTRAGWPIEDAIRTLAFFQLGGIAGGLIGGYLLDRVGAYPVLIMAFALGASLTAGIGLFGADPMTVRLLVVGAGFGIVGGQLVLTALAATVYSTENRSTGIGWALGVGRLGAVISPIIGGMALSAGLDQTSLFLGAAAPALVCLTATIILASIRRKHA